jgi:hypothetical protein
MRCRCRHDLLFAAGVPPPANRPVDVTGGPMDSPGSLASTGSLPCRSGKPMIIHVREVRALWPPHERVDPVRQAIT